MKASKEIKKHLKSHNWIQERVNHGEPVPKKYNHRKIRRLLNEIIGASHQLEGMKRIWKHSPYPEDRDQILKNQITEMTKDLNAARRDLKKETGE